VLARIVIGAATVTKARRVVKPPATEPCDIVVTDLAGIAVAACASFATFTPSAVVENGNDKAAVLPRQHNKNWTTRRRKTNFVMVGDRIGFVFSFVGILDVY
jgi:hypothetical protein